jgi:hypothetical protein
MSPSTVTRPCYAAEHPIRGWERCPLPAVAVLRWGAIELGACAIHAEPWYAVELPEGATIAEVEYPALASCPDSSLLAWGKHLVARPLSAMPPLMDATEPSKRTAR